MNLREYKLLQGVMAFGILAMIAWTLYELTHGGVYSWSLNMGTVVIFVLVSNSLLVERKVSELRDEIIQSKVEYGLQTGKNLKEGLDNES